MCVCAMRRLIFFCILLVLLLSFFLLAAFAAHFGEPYSNFKEARFQDVYDGERKEGEGGESSLGASLSRAFSLLLGCAEEY